MTSAEYTVWQPLSTDSGRSGITSALRPARMAPISAWCLAPLASTSSAQMRRMRQRRPCRTVAQMKPRQKYNEPGKLAPSRLSITRHS